MNIHEKLEQLGLHLPEPPKPGGNYVSVNVRGQIAYVAIQFPFKNGQMLYQGKLGGEISTEEGYKAMQHCGLNVLAQVNKYIGFEKVLGLNHLDAYYQAEPDFDTAPQVVNGASDLFVHVLGDKGIHSRAIFGVAKLSRNFCVGLTSTFTLI